MKMHIGKLIEEEVKRQGLTPNQFAGLISTSRTNVYHIFNRETIDMELLARISKALKRNFFVEMTAEMASLLGTATQPATMANYKLASLSNVISKEVDGDTYSFPEYSKDREGLKVVLKEYFESDHRMPLIILESGFTFGAREVVKQMANQVFRGCGSTPCPKMIDVTKVKFMPEKVLIDYIDKNTFDSVEDSKLRVNEIIQVQKEVTKKFVCIIHTDPVVSLPDTNDEASFDKWGSETGTIFSRYESCFITVYRWDRQSLLSWAEDNHLHEYVLNYIRKHYLKWDAPVDYQLSHIEVPLDQIFLGLRAIDEPADYPTCHTYSQEEWRFVSAFISEKRNIDEEVFDLKDFTMDVIDFNEGKKLKEQLENLKVEQASIEKEPQTPTLYCRVVAEGLNWRYKYVITTIDNVPLDIPSHIAAALPYLYSLALESDLKGLDEDDVDVEEKFYPWLKEHHPKVAQELEDAADDYFNDQMIETDDYGQLRDEFPSDEVDFGCFVVRNSRVYNFIFYDLLEWKISIVDA